MSNPVYTEHQIEFTPVKSSTIVKVAHLERQSLLLVEFNDGGAYVVAGVTQSEFEALLTAPSAGAHYAKHFRGRPCLKYRSV